MFCLPSSALQPLCQYPAICDKIAHLKKVSAPFRVISLKLESGDLRVFVKADDRQKSFYYFYDLQFQDEVALLKMRRSICKKSGYRQEQEFRIRVADIPSFNKPLTLRILRKTVRGDRLVCEEILKP